MNNYYLKKKNELRAEAIEHLNAVSELSLSWWDVADYCEQLEARAKRYGLIKEFRLNGVL